MATSEDNENCHHVQSDPRTCKIKLEKFHFEYNGVTDLRRKVPQGAESSPQVR